MRVFTKGGVELSIPKWITVKGNTYNVIANKATVNERHGAVFSGKQTFSIRTLTCSGVIPVDTWQDVERERSRLIALLEGKELAVYRDDNDLIYYKCYLSGGIKVGYYDGFNLSKVFTLDFVLHAFDPFGFGKTKTLIIPAADNAGLIENTGNHMTVPTVSIVSHSSLDGSILDWGGGSLVIADAFNPNGFEVVYKRGCLYLNGADITERLSDESILNPLVIPPGDHLIKTPLNTAVTITYVERFK